MPSVNGAHAWLGIGSLGIQPAEFAKIGTAIALASYVNSINVKQQNVNTVIIANIILLFPMVLILLQPDAGTFVVFTGFLFVMYREGLTYDPIVLHLVNLIPGVRFKSTWVGSHFIPILFVVVFLSITTLLMSNNTIHFFLIPGVDIPGFFGVIGALFFMGLATYLILRFFASKRERNRITMIVVIGFFLCSLMIPPSIVSSSSSLKISSISIKLVRMSSIESLSSDPSSKLVCNSPADINCVSDNLLFLFFLPFFLPSPLFLLNEDKFGFEKVEVEYALYDTNVNHDSKWILGT
jgi:hypothetical protein